MVNRKKSAFKKSRPTSSVVPVFFYFFFPQPPPPPYIPSKPKPKPNPKDRNTLLPKSCAIKISKPKVNTIYHELLKLDVTKFTNATAVLFRVFVELSVDSYIEEHTLASTPSAAKSGMNFQQKMNIVANHLEAKKLADAAICKGIKAAIDAIGSSNKNKYRAIFYYLLVKHFKKESVYNG